MTPIEWTFISLILFFALVVGPAICFMEKRNCETTDYLKHPSTRRSNKS